MRDQSRALESRANLQPLLCGVLDAGKIFYSYHTHHVAVELADVSVVAADAGWYLPVQRTAGFTLC